MTPAEQRALIERLIDASWKIPQPPWTYSFSENCTQPHAVFGPGNCDGSATSLLHTPWNRGDEAKIMQFVADMRNACPWLLPLALLGLEAEAVTAERDRLRELLIDLDRCEFSDIEGKTAGADRP